MKRWATTSRSTTRHGVSGWLFKKFADLGSHCGRVLTVPASGCQERQIAEFRPGSTVSPDDMRAVLHGHCSPNAISIGPGLRGQDRLQFLRYWLHAIEIRSQRIRNSRLTTSARRVGFHCIIDLSARQSPSRSLKRWATTSRSTTRHGVSGWHSSRNLRIGYCGRVLTCQPSAERFAGSTYHGRSTGRSDRRIIDSNATAAGAPYATPSHEGWRWVHWVNFACRWP